MDSAAKLHKVHRLDPTVMPANVVLEMATLGRSQGFGDGKGDRLSGGGQEGGCHHPGVEPAPSSAGLQPPSQLVYSAIGADVRDVIIDGKLVMENRKLLTLDEEEILRKAREYQIANFGLCVADCGCDLATIHRTC